MSPDKSAPEQLSKPGWSKLSIVFVVLLVPLAAVSLFDALRWYKIAGFARDVPLTQQQCKHIAREKLEGCEDLAIHHRSGKAFLACGSVATRRAHLDVGTYASNASDGLFSYDLATGDLEEIAIDGLGDDGYHALGIGIWDPYVEHAKPHNKDKGPAPEDTIIIMAINNRRNESVVEILEHQLGTGKASVVETARHPLISTPNGVLPTSARSFYISNDLWGRRSIVRTFEMATARQWSSVVYRDEDGSAITVADHLGFPNGIGTSYDDQLLYVSSSHAHVLIYKRLPGGKLILRDRIEVPVLSDNLRYAAHGAVVRISNNTGADLYYGVKYKQEVVFSEKSKAISPLSVADYSPEHRKLLLGNIVGNGFHICDAEL
ncbi:hypothetical protein SYNPS1DRAFT_26665 [Syncephalis pseudoplumigaleata]|uniref:Calcium-dependent phosphotriesterase n=1 Tax=Syncephalis pseudoplumigaleata TaxID=1712513 RepID=A0A4P9Z520_9FUNG|nr:hypothetical protein SYNPS1DRAFT_26665 [Syncephalis pseudoplumigaleata]|eukprot:RKP27697.1 hypothetical protein SYNPS1DRAFT_26665 [Syncephalis pseudoplumigaleata]